MQLWKSKVKDFLPYCVEIKRQIEKDNISTNEVFTNLKNLCKLSRKYLHKNLQNIANFVKCNVSRVKKLFYNRLKHNCVWVKVRNVFFCKCFFNEAKTSFQNICQSINWYEMAYAPLKDIVNLLDFVDSLNITYCFI